jgi:hypothetical protein
MWTSCCASVDQGTYFALDAGQTNSFKLAFEWEVPYITSETDKGLDSTNWLNWVRPLTPFNSRWWLGPTTFCIFGGGSTGRSWGKSGETLFQNMPHILEVRVSEVLNRVVVSQS